MALKRPTEAQLWEKHHSFSFWHYPLRPCFSLAHFPPGSPSAFLSHCLSLIPLFSHFGALMCIWIHRNTQPGIRCIPPKFMSERKKKEAEQKGLGSDTERFQKAEELHYRRSWSVEGAVRGEGAAAPLGSNEPGNEGREAQCSPLRLGFILSPLAVMMASSPLHQNSSTHACGWSTHAFPYFCQGATGCSMPLFSFKKSKKRKFIILLRFLNYLIDNLQSVERVTTLS